MESDAINLDTISQLYTWQALSWSPEAGETSYRWPDALLHNLSVQWSRLRLRTATNDRAPTYESSRGLAIPLPEPQQSSLSQLYLGSKTRLRH